MLPASLHGLLRSSAQKFPQRIAVIDPQGGRLSYAQLEAASDSISAQLRAEGVVAGDRVGIYLEKSLASVVSIFAILKAGAAYVPVDPFAPAERNSYIFTDCSARCVITDMSRLAGLQTAADDLAFVDRVDVSVREELGKVLLLTHGSLDCADSPASEPLAYILYTSGSTGRPKGVMHSHRSALSFIDWCGAEFSPRPDDRFSSHAPFHFDLSILDLFVSIKHGAAVILIGEELGKQPMRLAPIIVEQAITVWYSTPSILRLLVEFGQLDTLDLSTLRLLLFAGEVFPMKHLAALHKLLPEPRYYNLFGPTETNVCTYFEALPDHIGESLRPLPIGHVCSGDSAEVVGPDGSIVAAGSEGELLISGGSVMLGYWNLEAQNSQAFCRDAAGKIWYRTGDVVREDQPGVFTYLGRRDRMIKRRGFRVELGEIEVALSSHAEVTEAAVVASSDSDGQVTVEAYLTWSGQEEASILQLKRYCASKLPAYMVPDRFKVLQALPRTSTDKIDYQRLKELA